MYTYNHNVYIKLPIQSCNRSSDKLDFCILLNNDAVPLTAGRLNDILRVARTFCVDEYIIINSISTGHPMFGIIIPYYTVLYIRFVVWD